MENFLLTSKNKDIEERSKKLGFAKTYFIEVDFIIITVKTKNELLKKINFSKSKKDKSSACKIILIPETEDMLRFALERSSVDIIMGVEQIHPKDSLHYLRSGLDQILCKIAHDKDKMIAFSFAEVLKAKNQARLLARMKANIKLCQKYKVKMLFSSFASSVEDMRSAKDLEAFWRMLCTRKKK